MWLLNKTNNIKTKNIRTNVPKRKTCGHRHVQTLGFIGASDCKASTLSWQKLPVGESESVVAKLN